MEAPASTTTTPAGRHEETDPSLLHTAVKLGDLIRQHVREQSSPDESDSSKGFIETVIDPSATTPGLMEGIAAAIVTAGLLTPVRSTLIKSTSQTPLGVFTDLVTSSTLVIASSMAGMYVGSLVGSTAYLKQLAAVPTDRESVTADAVCGSSMVRELLTTAASSGRNSYSSESAASFALGEQDPRHQAILAYQQALQKCVDRAVHQQENEGHAFSR
ncbi:hypothetical protein MPSEU_000686000 [Mayamaea pseudoterrestris]|nr:hypothetical protein MPSEU_000686000 [Mayamaea pseudoterrestris]